MTDHTDLLTARSTATMMAFLVLDDMRHTNYPIPGSPVAAAQKWFRDNIDIKTTDDGLTVMYPHVEVDND